MATPEREKLNQFRISPLVSVTIQIVRAYINSQTVRSKLLKSLKYRRREQRKQNGAGMNLYKTRVLIKICQHKSRTW